MVADLTRRPELWRTRRLPYATALVVGTIIGSVIVVQRSQITALVPCIPISLLPWTVSGILTQFCALACAELSSPFPRAGAVYIFLRESVGPLVGFLWGYSVIREHNPPS